MSLFSWSTTASSNNTADSSINWREGQAPSTVNNSARAMMAAVAKWRDDLSGNLVTGGSSTAYTLSSNQTFTALTDGIFVTTRMSATNGASPTLNVDSLGAKAIQSVSGTAIPSGELSSGAVYTFVYDSSADAWIVHSHFASTLTADDIGFGTDDTPQLTGLELGHASDTTLTRASAGDVNIEGNVIYRAGGTDVAIADGGTNASSAADARTNLGLATVGQSEAEAGTGTTTRAWTAERVAQAIAAQKLVPASAQATTSGTAFDFTSIPAGANRITVMLDQVGLDGGDDLLVQLGDSGGIETTDYTCRYGHTAGMGSETSGFGVSVAGAVTGVIEINRISGNVWVTSYTNLRETSNNAGMGQGRKELSAELDRVRLTRTGTDTFDAGQVNIFYE